MPWAYGGPTVLVSFVIKAHHNLSTSWLHELSLSTHVLQGQPVYSQFVSIAKISHLLFLVHRCTGVLPQRLHLSQNAQQHVVACAGAQHYVSHSVLAVRVLLLLPVMLAMVFGRS
jgi:hypothetical protein